MSAPIQASTSRWLLPLFTERCAFLAHEQAASLTMQTVVTNDFGSGMIKHLSTILAGLFLTGGMALAQAPATVSASIAPQAGFLKSVRGDVQLLSADGSTRSAAAGDPVATVDRIVTGADAAASVVLRDGSALMIGPSSRLDVKEFHFDATTQDGGMLMSLLRGSLRMITGLIGKTNPDAVRIETQTATIGIRGTDFIVQADGKP